MEFIKNCFKSLYDFKTYKKLFRASKLQTFSYVVILAAVLGGILSIPYYITSKSSIDIVENNVSKIPDFIIKNNNLELKKDGPVVIKDNKMVLIFDSNSDSNSEYTKAENAVLWGKSCRKQKYNGKETGVAKYSDTKGITLNKQYVLDEAKSYKFLPLTCIIQNIAIAYMQIFMTSLIVVAFNFRSEKPMSFREIFKISSFAVTVPIILFTCLKGLGIGNIPIISWVFVIIQVLYTRKAIKVINDEDGGKSENKNKIIDKK